MFKQHRCTEFGMEEQHIPGDGVVTGWGTVNGRTIYVFSKDFTVFGGSLSEAARGKNHQAAGHGPCRTGPRLSVSSMLAVRAFRKAWPRSAGMGEVFRRNVLASGVIPQISLIMGPCAGGDVYSPAMTDFIFMVRDTSYMFVTGPDVVKTVTNETVTAEELGGCLNSHHKVVDLRRCLRQRRGSPVGNAAVDRFPADEQSGRPAGTDELRRPGADRHKPSTRLCRTIRTSPTTCVSLCSRRSMRVISLKYRKGLPATS